MGHPEKNPLDRRYRQTRWVDGLLGPRPKAYGDSRPLRDYLHPQTARLIEVLCEADPDLAPRGHILLPASSNRLREPQPEPVRFKLPPETPEQ